MKKNFIISNIKELWLKDTDDLFIADPYIDYLLKYQKEDGNYRSIEVAQFLRTDRQSVNKDIEFIQQKYEKYVPILAKRLNKLHNSSYSERFWQKSLSMALFRYLTLFHDVFSRCEVYFNPQKHTCQVLSPKSYYTPLDFEDHRTVFQASHFGQEQIFSHYIQLFYPGQFNTIELKPQDFDCEFVPKQAKFELPNNNLNKKPLSFKKLLKSLSMTIKKHKQHKKIEVGILGSFFSSEHMEKLIYVSEGKIHPVEIDFYNQKMIDKPVNYKKRFMMSEFEADFDRFDKFFFSTLPYCLPRAFVENFKDIYKSSLKKTKKCPQMKFVTSEAWLSDTYISMALATMKENNIAHIYNEHNCIFHPFIGKMVHNQASLVDHYVTFGWHDDKIPNLIKGASLFPFTIENTFEKKYHLLYVSYTAEAKMSLYGGYYGDIEVNAPKYLEFTKTFMNRLNTSTFKKMAYRGYPKDYAIKGLLYDKESYLNDYLQHVEMKEPVYSNGETCREQMLKSRLVVIDYKSTAYLESLMMNIPTVFFWNPDADYLEEHHSDFYQPLIDVGICQTDPVEAAKFVENIINNPEEWWQQEEVQKKKEEFLNRNFQKPQVMINYLLGLLKDGDKV